MSAETRDVLQRRAARLARPLAEARPSAVLEFLLVSAGRAGHFALEARAVRGILRDEPLCRLSESAGALLAVAVVGGETVPVADLGALFDGGEPRRDRPFLVIVEGGTGPVGFLVDEVQDVVTLHRDDLRAVSSAPGGDGDPAAHSLLTPSGAVVLDTEPLLSDGRLAIAPPSQRTRAPTAPATPQGTR